MEFEEVYSRYFGDIYRYLLGLCGEAHLAEELTQETFFKALGALDGFDGRKDIRAWLFTIGKNAYRSCLRRDRRTDALETGEEPVSDVNFVERLMDEEQCFLIHRFLHTMPEPYKEVFNLRVFGELSFERIGKIFGRSAGWARVTYHRARKQIIEYMEGMDHEKNQL